MTTAGPRRRRRTAAIVAVVVIGALLTGGAVWSFPGLLPVARPAPQAAAVNTATVLQGDLVEESTQLGELAFSDGRSVTTRRAGTVTALPAAGTVIAPGGVLYRIDTRPVVLLRGDLPVWRDLAVGMSNGDDVRQLEQNLHDLGFFSGDVDRAFTARTATAVRAWQASLGIEPTGVVAASDILFSPIDLRIGSAAVALGAEVGDGTGILLASSTAKTVTVDLRLADQQLAIVGGPVTVVLPDATEAAGVIATVGQPQNATDAAASDGEAPPVVVPVTVTLSDPTSGAAFPRAAVTVRFPSTVATDALTVPVDALIAIAAGRFAVQVPRDGSAPATLPVTVGAFQAGRVQITGDGIERGSAVIVP